LSTVRSAKQSRERRFVDLTPRVENAGFEGVLALEDLRQVDAERQLALRQKPQEEHDEQAQWRCEQPRQAEPGHTAQRLSKRDGCVTIATEVTRMSLERAPPLEPLPFACHNVGQ
jgi:hypothetical protein